MVKEIFLKTEKDTQKLAEKFAHKLKKGDVIALTGDLGSGKTYFTSNLCKFMGIDDIVSSPSFVILNEYDGNPPIFHYDLYRLGSPEEVIELGMLDFMDQGITIIEWPDLAKDFLPEHTIYIEFQYAEHSRIAFIKNFNLED